MKRFPLLGQKPYGLAFVLVPLLLYVLACGCEEATPTPAATATATATAMATATATATAVPTATPTTGPAATPTPTRAGPVATPTPTAVAAPTATPTPGVQPKRGGAITQSSGTNLPHWDGQAIAWAQSLSPLYSNLFYNSRDDIITCEICTEWHLENSGKTMVFNLIKGIKFHDGREMTSADVAYSLNKMMGQIDGIISPRCGLIKEYINTIETPDAYQMKINLVRPSVMVPKVLSSYFCVLYPKGTTRENLGVKPYGSGPFILKEWTPGVVWKLERNPNYFKPGLPYLDSVEMIMISGTPAIMAAFFTHRFEHNGGLLKPAASYYVNINKLKAEGKILTRKAGAGCRPQGMFMNNSKPPFNDINVRKAANLALDRTAYGVSIWENDYVAALLYQADTEFGRPASEIWNVVAGWGTGAKKVQEIEEGRLLLAQTYPKGIDTEAMNQDNTGGQIITMGQLVQEMIAKVGIRGPIKITQGAAEADPKRAALDYLYEVVYRCQVTFDPDEMVGSYWITGGNRSWQGYANAEVDKLWPLMSAEQDPAKRKQLVRQIEEIIIVKDVAMGAMPDTFTEHFWWKRLQGAGGMGISPAYGSGWSRLEEWWLLE
ncbi:MAG: ABC transporter substrate-binding protein [Chloroflexota bacterium]